MLETPLLEIKPFAAVDLLSLELRDPDKAIMASVDSMKMAEEYVKRGPCWTLWSGTAPVACAGVIMLWPGVGESWAATSPLVSQFPFSFHRAAKRVLRDAIQQLSIHRLQVSIPETHMKSCEWIVRLGFEFESLMPKYGPSGDTWVRFACLS